MLRNANNITFALSDKFCPNTNPPDETEEVSPLFFSLFGDLLSPLICKTFSSEVLGPFTLDKNGTLMIQ